MAPAVITACGFLPQESRSDVTLAFPPAASLAQPSLLRPNLPPLLDSNPPLCFLLPGVTTPSATPATFYSSPRSRPSTAPSVDKTPHLPGLRVKPFSAWLPPKLPGPAWCPSVRLFLQLPRPTHKCPSQFAQAAAPTPPTDAQR